MLPFDKFLSGGCERLFSVYVVIAGGGDDDVEVLCYQCFIKRFFLHSLQSHVIASRLPSPRKQHPRPQRAAPELLSTYLAQHIAPDSPYLIPPPGTAIFLLERLPDFEHTKNDGRL